jgi:hypothetical protein
MVTHVWQTTDAGDRAEAVAAVLAAGDPRGWTAVEIAETLDLSLDVGDVQRDLEGLVTRALLTRHGIGREALYTLPPRADQADARARGCETLRHGTQRPRAVGRADGTTDPPLALEYATVRTAYEAVRRGVVGTSLEGAGTCPRLAAEMRALVALAAALHQHEHALVAAERGCGQPERRRSDRPWAPRPRGDTAATRPARAHAPAATSA